MKKVHRKTSYKTQLTKQLNKNKKQVKFNDVVLISKWINSKGETCKIIQKKHLCFCGHQYKHHRLLSKKLICDEPGCKCSEFQYVPNLFLNCICHHNIIKHSKQDKHCSHCTYCLGFTTDWHCRCGQRYSDHNNTLQYCHPEIKKNVNTKSCVILPNISIKQSNQNSKIIQDKVIQNDSKIYKHQKQNDKNIMRNNNNNSMSIANINSNKYKNEDDQVIQQDLYSIYLHNKLKQVNKRYFSKFANKKEQFMVNTFEQDQKDGLNLYLKPHYYQKVPISNIINNNIHF